MLQGQIKKKNICSNYFYQSNPTGNCRTFEAICGQKKKSEGNVIKSWHESCTVFYCLVYSSPVTLMPLSKHVCPAETITKQFSFKTGGSSNLKGNKTNAKKKKVQAIPGPNLRYLICI